MTTPPRAADQPEVIGFGALNVDCIASASRLSQRAAEKITESVARFEWNREGPADEQTIVEAMRHLGTASLGYSLGGSAWLTTYALAQMRLGVRLGYVGMLGRVQAPGLSFTGQMDELGIDRRWVGQTTSQLCGLCLSYIDDVDRVMLTHPGANVRMADHLDEHFDGIAEYLAGARYVHVTSFFDNRTPDRVRRVLLRAKALNPAVKISFDPGFDWAAHSSPAIDGILGLADLLFVNYREFKALGHYRPGEPDDFIARKVLRRCAPGCWVFVTKRYDVIEVLRRSELDTQAYRFQLVRPVRETELEDATGAGDVFSAAVLGALASNQLNVELGAFLGLCLARHRMVSPVRSPRSPLPDLRKGFLQQSESLGNGGHRPPGVFIAHDTSPHGQAVRAFLEKRCGLRTYSISAAAGTPDFTVQLRRLLNQCGFAVCVLSAGRTDDEGGRSDQHIVHQAGVFQGRYGFGRVALLTEEGYDTFSNIAGLIRLDFPPGHVDATFIELGRMLRREGLIRHGGARRD
ncbi:PfkB family carbohydrate kinase [Lentzea sp.]|uniref:PfkB family carbohydrate kinase n=1 Tax=Lentzea sp. TaxID=56099 RepID=UPI002BD1EBE1|nr:PfkB family carbohydrate kinase [Lentzea sp.]HUQ59598.1 PfkB family carbohydrate kinase [Lentzea sp.]